MMLQDRLDIAQAGAIVIPFPGRSSRASLSVYDRMEVAAWQGCLRNFGYDRMVIHERGPLDPPDVDCFLSIYRNGEAWSRWGIARCGASVLVWCSVSGADVGRFASMSDALQALFPGTASPAERHAGAEVIHAFC